MSTIPPRTPLRWPALILLIFLGLCTTLYASSAPVWAQECPDHELVFARGTSESPGLGYVGDNLAQAIRTRGISLATYPVNYPADYDFTQAISGASDANNHIMSLIARCPATGIILGGYSQGAAVVDMMTSIPVGETLPAPPVDNLPLPFGITIPIPDYRHTRINPLPAGAASHIRAVVAFGNPTTKLGKLLTTSPTYGNRALDVCHEGDPICSDGLNPAAHTSYVPTDTNQAAEFITAHL